MFKVFNDCIRGNAWDSESKLNSFMFCRFLASSPQTIFYANFINCRYRELPDEAQYKFIQSIKNKPKYIQYVAAPKTGATPEDYDDIMARYDISPNKAREYLEILNLIKKQKEQK